MADGYVVIGQRQSTRLSETGRFEEVIEVTFKMANGAVASIRVPEEAYDPEFVREAIEHHVSVADAIHQL